MSYQVLARKWRPNKFEEVVGQQHVLQALSNALTHQRLHHAYLLTGTRGVGKTTIARILSKSLNCTQGISATPCGECEACVQIEEGRFVDLMEIDAASRTKVEDTREILDNVQYRPSAGRYKVYLIDEVHMLSRHSFNALLKTLEEPPPHVIFLLATTDPDKLPVTVLSRCLQFNLRSLTREEIAGQLAHILQQESIPFDEPALGLLARAAQGSMRDALSLTDQAIAQGNNEVRTTSVEQMLGRIDPQNMLALLSAIAAGHVDSSLDQLRALVDKMPDIGDALTEMQNILHQVALAQAAPAYLDSELIEHKEAFSALCKQLAPEEVQVYYRIVLEGRRELPFAPDAFAGVEMTILRLLSFRPEGKSDSANEKKNDDLNVAEDDSDTPEDNAPPWVENETEIESSSLPSEHPTQGNADANEGNEPRYEEPSAHEEEPSAHGEEPSAHEEEPSARGYSVPSDNATPSESSQEKSIAELMAMRNSMSEKLAQNDFTPIDATVPDGDAPSRADDATQGNAVPSENMAPPCADDAMQGDGLPSENMAPPRVDDATQGNAMPSESKAPPSFDDGTQSDASASGSSPDGEVKLAAEIDSWAAAIDGLSVGGRVRQVLLNSNLHRTEQGYNLVIDAEQRALCNDRLMQQLEQDLATLVRDKPLQVTFGEPESTPLQIQQQIDQTRLAVAQEKLNAHEGFKKLREALGASVQNIRPE